MVLLSLDSLCTFVGFSMSNISTSGIAEYFSLHIFTSLGFVKFLSDIAVLSSSQPDTFNFANWINTKWYFLALICAENQ